MEEGSEWREWRAETEKVQRRTRGFGVRDTVQGFDLKLPCKQAIKRGSKFSVAESSQSPQSEEMEFQREVGWMGIAPPSRGLFCFLLLATVPWTAKGNADVDALSAFRQALSDPSQALRTWDVSVTSPCTWFHVTCNTENRVIRVDLGNASLAGPVVPELGNLTELQNLELYDNNFNGSIPVSLAKLKDLVTLDLYGNQLTGAIPAALGNLTKLDILRLNNNSFTGTIPEELSFLDNLRLLDLSYNFLSGDIPVTGVFASFNYSRSVKY